VVWALYRQRVLQVARQFEARLAERTRIARELHDTLLQSFQASLLQMQSARNLLSRRPEQAVQNLDGAILMAAGAIAEGRDAIQHLRSHAAFQGDLSQLLTVTGHELRRPYEVKEEPVTFRVAVEGERHDLEPLLQDEVYRMARELIRNAFQHAEAKQIEAEIRYEHRRLRVYVRDDGKGIDPEILKAGGRDGHWGLAGMRERAKKIGARLDFWSEAGAGTEVQLTVPSSIAYRAVHSHRRFKLFRRKRGVREQQHQNDPGSRC
jgi:signal transduction histidine kinase